MAEPFDFDSYLNSTGSAPSLQPGPVDFDSYIADANKERFGDSAILAGLAGAARGATFGLSDVAGSAIGLKEELAALKEYNPTASLIGEIGGAIAPTLLTGGAGAVGAGARLAAAPVSAVTRAGAAVEGAIARKFIQEASKQSARNVLKSAGAKFAGSAVEGLAYGAGQVVSEAALGDPEKVAEDALATMGLSAALGGSLGAGAKIVGEVVKGAASSLKPYMKNLKQNLVGISDDSAKVILAKPDAVQELSRYGDELDDVFKNLATEKASEASSARYGLIENVRNEVKDLIQKNGLSGKTVSVNSLFDAIDETRKRVSPRGKAVTGEVRGTLASLQSIEDDLLSYARQSAGLGNEVPLTDVRKLIQEDKLKLNALDLNDLKAQYYASTKDSLLVSKTDPVNSLYERLGSLSNKSLDEIDPAIRKANARLSNTLAAQEKLKNFGLYDRYEFDPEKLKKIYSLQGSKWVEVKDSLKVLDDAWGTNLLETAELARAYKELFPKDVLSRSFTGRSLFAPTLGAAAGGLIGGPVGAAAGVLASAAGASPIATKFKLEAVNAAENIINKSLRPKLSALGTGANKLIPSNIGPFLSSKVAALATLERMSQQTDRQINGAVNGFFQQEPDGQLPTSFNSLKQTSFTKPYARSLDDRIEAFNKRLNEIYDISQDANSLTERISENTKAITYVAPQISEKLLAKSVQAVEFLKSKAPKNLIMDPLQPIKTDFRPSDAELARFERYVEAVENPFQVLKDLKKGIVTQEQVETLKTLYPQIYDRLSLAIREKAAVNKKPLSYSQKNVLSTLFQQPLTQLHKPQVLAMLQGNMNPDGQNESVKFSNTGRKLALSNLTETQRIESGGLV